MKKRYIHSLLALSALACLFPTRCHADSVTFAGTGTGTSGQQIAASASFLFVTYDFGDGLGPVDSVQLTLRNTAVSTSLRSNLLTGVFFSLTGTVGNLPTSSSGFDGTANVLTTTGTVVRDIAPAVNNTATDGGFQLANGPFGTANSGVSYAAFRYGISTVGGGLAGFNGAALNAGNGGDDYGIFAAGSDTSSGQLAALRPIVNSSATFYIKRPTGWTTATQVSAVRFGYGSLPDNQLEGSLQSPEPSTFGLLALGGGLIAWAGRNRQKRLY